MNTPAVDAVAIQRAVDVLRRGGIVALPTETVYGLAADADNEDAVRKLFAAKGRPADHPVIVHVSGADAFEMTQEFARVARDLLVHDRLIFLDELWVWPGWRYGLLSRRGNSRLLGLRGREDDERECGAEMKWVHGIKL